MPTEEQMDAEARRVWWCKKLFPLSWHCRYPGAAMDAEARRRAEEIVHRYWDVDYDDSLLFDITHAITDAVAQAVEAALVADRLARHDETVAAIEVAVKGKECLTCGVTGGHKSGCYELMLNDLFARLASAEADVDTFQQQNRAWIRENTALTKERNALKAECAIKNARIKDLLESETEEITRLKAERDSYSARLDEIASLKAERKETNG